MARNSRLDVEETMFTVTYLGSDECRTLRGEDVTEPVIKTFIYGDNSDHVTAAKTVLLSVGHKHLTLTQLIQKKHKVGQIMKVKGNNHLSLSRHRSV